MKNILFKNIGFLTLSQIANYLLPLVTIPYVTRIVGPENFGTIEFVQATILFFTVTLNYGFNRTATRAIAADSGNMEKVSELFSSVMLAKTLLLGSSMLVFGILLLTVPKFLDNYIILIAGFPIVIGWGLYPSFIFEGLQKLSVVAVVDVFIKSTAAVCILVLINNAEDYYKVPLINGLIQMVFGFVALVYALKKIDGLRFIKTSWQKVKAQLREGQYVYFSSLFTTVYNFGIILFGAFLLGPIELGIFVAAYKLIVVGNSFLFKPLTGALFPFLSLKLADGIEVYKKSFKNAFFLLVLASAVASLMLFFLASFLLNLVFGENYLEAENILKIMAPTLFVGAFLHMFLQQGLLHLHKDKLYMSLIISGGVLSIVINFILIKNYEIVGAAVSRLVVDVYLALVSGFFFFKKIHKNTSESS